MKDGLMNGPMDGLAAVAVVSREREDAALMAA